MSHAILNKLEEIIIESPADIIIRQIRNLLTTGELKPGDRLPAERQLADRFRVGRSFVRDAIKKLEFYGIVKTLPQSGSYIAGLEISAMEGMIMDILKMDNYDVYSLVETRLILEVNAVKLCALRRTEKELLKLERAMVNFELKLENGLFASSVEDDMIFHRTIAEGSKNLVLKSLLVTITPDIMTNYSKHKMCDTHLIVSKASQEHRELLNAIRNKDADKAEDIMREHLEEVVEYARKL